MKKLFFLFLFLITQINFGQSNIVEINTTGSGETKEEAVQNALLSALKQSFGVFISSNTEIINDVLTKDKISELSSGNILEYNILSETQNGNYYNTLVSSKISMNTLASYTKNKVDSNEISGDVFVSNFLIKELNKENELQSIKDLIEYSKKVLPTTLDFYINSGEPITVTDEQFDDYIDTHNYIGETRVDYRNRRFPKNFPFQFMIESKIGYTQNINYENWKNHFNKTIKLIDLNKDEISDYLNLKISTYPLILNNEVLYLRNYDSIKSLIEFYVMSTNYANYFTLKMKGLNVTFDFKNFNIHLKDFGMENEKYFFSKRKGQNKIPHFLAIDKPQFSIIENGKIEYLEYCRELGNIDVYDDAYEQTCRSKISDNFNKFLLDDASKKARFPYGNLTEISDINNGQSKYMSFSISGTKEAQIQNLLLKYFDRRNFPKKFRTKDNYKKIENELLILYQPETVILWDKYFNIDLQKKIHEKRLRKGNYAYYGTHESNSKENITLILQTNLSFSQSRIIQTFFSWEELKEFKGFQITNSN